MLFTRFQLDRLHAGPTPSLPGMIVLIPWESVHTRHIV
jgi:hypothetical protein